MRPRSFAALGLLLLGCAAGAYTLAAGGPEPQTGPAAKPRIPLTIDGVRDTGQYLPDSAVIARVDGRPIRIGQFIDRWFSSYLLDRPKTDSAGRYAFLNSMVNRLVLADLAREVSRPLSFEDRATLRETQSRLLSNVTFARLVADSAGFTEDELRHAYAQSCLELHLQRIVTARRADAVQARADLLAKRLTWAEALRRYSPAPGDQGSAGDRGWVNRAAFPPGPALEIFDLPDGGISDVFSDTDGWQFVRVVGRRARKQPEFRLMTDPLANELRIVKRSQRAEVVRGLVRRQIGMVYDTTNIAWAAERFAELERSRRPEAGQDAVIDLTGQLPEIAPEDTSRLLARWQDGRFSLGDFLNGYDGTEVLRREKVSSFDAFRTVLDRLALESHMADLAIARGLDRDPVVMGGMAKKEEEMRVEHLYRDSVEARLWVSTEERQKYYEAHLPDYYGLPSVTYAAFARHSRAGADSLVARIKAGEPAAGIMRADSLAGFVSGSIRTENERSPGQFYKLLTEEMREGEVRVLGPDKFGDYLVLDKLVHDPGHQLAFKEVESLVDESVQNLKASQMLDELIARHRRQHDVEMHPELLMRIRLLDPTIH